MLMYFEIMLETLGQADDRLDVTQTYTHRRNYDIAVCFYAR